MSSIRDRLAAKARRRVVIPVLVSDPTEDRRRAAVADAEFLAAQARPARAGDLPALQEAAAAARAAVAQHFEDVAFRALRPDDLEALIAEHSKGEEPDRDALRAALAAECAEDEALRDEAWWREQLDPKTTSWSSGERDQLYFELLTGLHYTVPAAALPKD
ncbi:hypothetical protein [Actinotalea sp. JY-7876]|uniref:hypothetical protein n=1 Tax=Actinotalea sp. JY-7876 TaxID=2758442 RepID=UPI0015F768C1|nr:hypothetical protein [Actinotalea sp. JY-7876]